MRRYSFFPILVLAVSLMLIQGCASTDTLIERGNYDQAIAYAQNRLTGKQRKNPKLVRAVEEAFAKVTAQDMREIDRLKNSGNGENWGRVNTKYREIRKRQNALEPLLPLVDKNGYQATFSFVNTLALEEESRNKAAEYHYAEGQDLLIDARAGNKLSARTAYREFRESQNFIKNYRESNRLMETAHEYGISHVLVGVKNDAPVVTPNEFERRLQAVNVADLNSFWQKYHLNDEATVDFDYRINLRITDIAVSPEIFREREYVDIKEIEDGYEYVLDNNGNVLKDTLGNDVTIPRIVLIKAWVLETRQEKQADVAAVLEVFDYESNSLIRSQTLGASAFFENCAATFRGDRRALSNDTRRRIGNSPQPYPSNELLILQAADQLKPALLDRLVDYRDLVMN